jgi:hypothetical protein
MRARTLTGGIALLALALVIGTPAAARQLLAPAGGQVYALIVGINGYPHAPRLKGALQDAQDFRETLLRAGVAEANITALFEEKATRPAVSGGMERLVNRAKAKDFVLITFAGHGKQFPERVKGSKPDGKDEGYLLYNFDLAATGEPDIIIGQEMKHWLGKLEAKGVDVVFVDDTCFGGGMTRKWDPRSGELTYRSFDFGAEAAAENLAHTVAEPSDSFKDESTFKRVTFLGAVDRNTLAPEVEIPGQPTKRGALSYSVARAIDGITGGTGGTVSRGDLFTHARQTALQYSHNKQVIVTEPTAAAGALDVPVLRFAALAGDAAAPAKMGPVRVTVVNGAASALAKITPVVTPFEVVANSADAEVTWDARAKDAIVAGDVIAHDIGADDIPGVVDRVRALSEIAKLSEKAPQTFVLMPNNRLHHARERVILKATGALNKYAIIFNITGNGTVQFLFPKPGDRPQIDSAEWQFADQIDVQPPFGADTVVAITSDQRLDALENAIRTLNDRRAAGQVPQWLEKLLPPPPAARLGFTNIFTAP